MGRISREELLQRYAAGERNFSGAKLEGMLDGIDLSGADLSGNRKIGWLNSILNVLF